MADTVEEQDKTQFTYKVTNFTDTTLIIMLSFENAAWISSNEMPDKIKITFTNPEVFKNY